jgi:nucleoside-diphosphate-sugar epimerase
MSMQEVFLITGGNGFVASQLVPLLLSEGPDREIIVVSRKQGRVCRLERSGIRYVYGDLKEKSTWAELPRTITHVFHLAAFIPWGSEDRNRSMVAEENLIPIAHMIETSRQWPHLTQVVFSSSVAVYAKSKDVIREDSLKSPADIYGASKLAGEDLLLCLAARGTAVSALRYSSIYGFGQYQGTVLPVMIKRALQKKEILVFGRGERTQDFVHCADAAFANLLAYRRQSQGIFNIGSGVPISMISLAQLISRIFTDNEAQINLLTEKEDYDPGLKLDISKASRQLGYAPNIAMEEGLRQLKQMMQEG